MAVSSTADYNLGRAHGKIEFDYDDSGEKKAKAGLASLEQGAVNTRDAVKKTSTAFVAVGAAIVGGLALAVNTAASFEERISAIGAVSGATAKELEAVTDKALQLGADTKFSASEAASAMEELVKAGLSVDEVLGGAADATVALAAAGEVELPRAAEIAANAMNVFQLSAKEMPKVADLIAGAANASAIDVEEFGQALSQSGAAAALAGVPFEDLSVAIALMGNAGIKGSDAGTSLKTMLLSLNPTTQKQIDLMKELGIVTEDGSNKFFDAQGNAKSLADISGVLEGALAGMTKQQQLATLETLFGTDALRASSILAREGAEGFHVMADAMGEISAADVAAQRMDNLKGDLEELKGSAETAAIILGTIFIPVLRDIAAAATSALNFLTDLPEPIQKLGAFAALATGGLLLLLGVTAKIVLAVQAAMPVLHALGIALKFIATSPIVLIIAAIIALIAGIIYAYQNFETFRNIVNTVIAALVSFFKAVMAAVQIAIAAVISFGVMLIGIFQNAYNVIRPLVDAIVKLIVAGFKLWWAVVSTILNLYWHLIQFVWDIILAIIRTAMNILVPIIKAGFNAVWKIIQAVWNVITAVINAAWKVILALIKGAINTAVSIINGITRVVDIIRNAFNRAKQAVVSVVTSIIAFIRNFPETVVNIILGLGSKLFNAGKRIMQQLKDGISSMVDAVVQPVKDAAGFIADLWPFSPAKSGPLKKHPMDKAGSNLMRDLAEGITSSQREAIDAMKDVALAMPVTIGGATVPIASQATATHTGDTRTFAPTVTVEAAPNIPTERQIVDQLSRFETLYNPLGV